MELYVQVRRSVCVEGLSEREAARRFGIARETVRKMLRYRIPPGYRRSKPARRPKLEAFTGIIDQILTDDRERPRKQRHTAQRIFDRLRDEYGFTGGYTTVKDYVREKKLGGQEMFVPLTHPPGDAQADFGEAVVVINGVQRKAHFLVVDLPHSDDAFVKAFPAETTEAFCEGHNAAFRYFGGVPRSIVYDNTKLAVARILGDGTRQRTRVFSELQSHYLFADRFGRPGKGNDKGKVEGLVGYDEREELIFDPLHYLALLERKTNALDQAAPLVGWQLPQDLVRLRRLLEVRLGKPGKREYVQVLRLLEDFPLTDVTAAARQAVELGTIGFDAVKHLVLCRIEQRPPRLDLTQYPHLPTAQVEQTSTTDYLVLLAQGVD